jgi:hypothetical protein
MSCRAGLHNHFVEVVVAAMESLSLRVFLLCDSFNISNSFPSFHLLWERTLRAVGIISHAKVFVNLEQTLLVRDGFQELFPAWIVSEQTRRPCFESAVR